MLASAAIVALREGAAKTTQLVSQKRSFKLAKKPRIEKPIPPGGFFVLFFIAGVHPYIFQLSCGFFTQVSKILLGWSWVFPKNSFHTRKSEVTLGHRMARY